MPSRSSWASGAADRPELTGATQVASLVVDPAAQAAGSTPIEVIQVSKRFGATQALDGVSLALIRGEVHGFAGENGAGKSTLGKIISGLYTPDSGTLLVNGDTVDKWDTSRAQRDGVVLIAQELSLVPHLSVADNVFLGVESHRRGVLRRDTKERYERLDVLAGFGLNPNSKVDDLRLADRQKVEILRALARDAKVIIMDEPTSSLTSDEVEKLHAVIRRLSDQGRTIIYVSHFLEALLETTDRISVLRDGRLVNTSLSKEETKSSLVEQMLGRSISAAFPPRPKKPDPSTPPLLEVRDISGPNGTHEVSFTIRPGEIVGLVGLVGSGRSEIARIIFGADDMTDGHIALAGKPLANHAPRESVAQGLVLIPEDRRAEGLVLVRSVKENITLPHLGRVSAGGVLNSIKESRFAKDLVAKVRVMPPRTNALVSDFSGGNQQKVLLAKWMMGDPAVIIFDEPTRGVDIGAKVTIYETIIELAETGVGILLISSEHEEVMALSHRVHLIRENTVIGEVDPTSTSVDEVLLRLFDLDNAVSTGGDER
jgi:ABC-type sugar transport system ATPase subunit